MAHMKLGGIEEFYNRLVIQAALQGEEIPPMRQLNKKRKKNKRWP